MKIKYAFATLVMIFTTQGCAHGEIEKRIDDKLARETAVQNRVDMSLEAKTQILNAPNLSDDQKSQLLALHKSARSQLAALTNQSLRLPP